ncbi:Fe-S-containing protein [Campylobacter sp. RM12637]|uniref:Fe-S-containing protein n=1 Tax=Campylobacter sp. RM12637 TaxID=2735734 RepID=UPI003014C8CB|nr:DUF2318 domain-containing protein [Campylobacter sp. RM12637]
MSIYFVHIFLECFLVSFFTAFYAKNSSLKLNIIFTLVGFIFGYILFYIFHYEKVDRIGVLTANIILLVTLFFSLIKLVIFKNNSLFAYILSFFISLAASLKYFLLSVAYPIFSSSLLDTQGILNFGFILLAIFICIIFYINFLFANSNSFSKSRICIYVIFAIMFLNTAFAEIMYYLIRIGVSDSSVLLSYITKSRYYAEFYYYICLILGIVYVGTCLKNRPKYREKACDFDIEYRKNIAKTFSINSHFTIHFILSISAALVMLFYDLVDSKPIQVDEPKIITPKNKDYFEFDAKDIQDGKLYRYAYISSSGKEIRFFIINRHAGKQTPVVVFDACSICGDNGYVMKNNELLCVACNVRIFLPSVGKEGGCNPIPLKFEVINDKIIVKVKDILGGENYFSKVVEMQVQDPVNKEKFLNTKAKKTYIYNGISYYFNSDESYQEFKKDPSKFVSSSDKALFLIERRS